MKPIAWSVLILCAGLTGCQWFSDAGSQAREKFAARDDGRTRTFAAPQRATYQAVRKAAEHMGFRFLRGGAAQGYLEAVSGLGQGETNRSVRQLVLKVELRRSLDEGTEVIVRLTEVIETESANRAALATESPLQGTPQYEVFFRNVQQAIDVQGTKE
jgi:hypothetical protein